MPITFDSWDVWNRPGILSNLMCIWLDSREIWINSFDMKNLVKDIFWRFLVLFVLVVLLPFTSNHQTHAKSPFTYYKKTYAGDNNFPKNSLKKSLKRTPKRNPQKIPQKLIWKELVVSVQLDNGRINFFRCNVFSISWSLMFRAFLDIQSAWEAVLVRIKSWFKLACCADGVLSPLSTQQKK